MNRSVDAGLRPLNRADIPRIVVLHQQELADSFLPMLGSTFLKKMYATILEEESGFGFAVEGNGAAVGFIVCTTDRARTDKALRRKRLALGLCALPKLLATPSHIPRLLDGLAYAHQEHPCPAELIIIIVDGSAQSGGLGSHLLQAARHEFISRGVERFAVTVTVDNVGAKRFYERAGMILTGIHKVFGREMAEYAGLCRPPDRSE